MAVVVGFMPNKALLPMPSSRLSFYQSKTMIIRCGPPKKPDISRGKKPQINAAPREGTLARSKREEDVTLARTSFNSSEKESKGRVDDGMESEVSK
ncbi:hypothetical protein MANES_15G096900v8 [Manihot esculenta]|uniref:Uncharacterized protein n=1 Tax=Manihot esculenta TaxID=3983 RepID=A0A2C9UEG9_MANES|nr:hypothetical protein MANES_15G096900v8 [Manihot esculenta]